MNRIFLAAILSVCIYPGFSQGMFGMEGGAGKATLGKSYLSPAMEGYFLKKYTRSLYFGGMLSYERYSFLYSEGVPAGAAAKGSVLSIRQKSGYIFLSPMVDLGIGYRKYIHVRATFGAGLLADASQTTFKYQQYITTPPISTGYDTASYNTSANIPVLVSHYTLGVSGRIPTSGYWNVMLSLQYSDISTGIITNGPKVKTNYFAFTVGVMHKYPMVLVEY